MELIQMGLVNTESEGNARKGRAKVDPPPGGETAPGGSSLTRITVNFTPRATEALEKLAVKTGDSKTDILNRAVMVLEVVVEALERGQGKVIVENPDGTKEVWRLMG
jgi:hypothetical protein